MHQQKENTHSYKHKFMECTACNTTHIVIANVSDERPSCKKCGGFNFKPRLRGVPGYMPEFCDQKKDQEIWDGVLAATLPPILHWKRGIEEKYKIKLSRNDIRELANSIGIVGKVMVNFSRDEFIKDKFVRRLRGVYRSFLYSRKPKIMKK
jgi:hypothetical protein